MVEFLLALLLLPMAYAEEEGEEETSSEIKKECVLKDEPCTKEYFNLIRKFASSGCNDFPAFCQKYSEDPDCKDLQAMAAKFQKFPKPAEFITATPEACNDPESACSPEEIKQRLQRVLEREKTNRRCYRVRKENETGPKEDVRFGDVFDLPFPSLNAPRAPERKGADEIKFPDGHVFLELEQGVILAGYKECLEKQAAAKTSEKEAFCQRLFTSPTQEEGGKGKMPAELDAHLSHAFAAGIAHQKTIIKIEFWTHEGCKTELKKLDVKHGGILAYFRPFSRNLDEVCAGLIAKKVGDLWSFVTGSRDTNSSPRQMRGRFLPK